MKTKKLNKRGGLTIPKDLRVAAGLFPSSAVEIRIENGSAIITAKEVHADEQSLVH